MGSGSKIAIVHNGIIENYRQLKELERKGVVFVSQTDSEVIAQLTEYYYNGNLLDTVIRVSSVLEGSYALAIMCLEEPEVLIATKKDNPLIIGAAADAHFIASDVPALLSHTNKVYYLDDKEIAVIKKDSVQFYNQDKEPVTKSLETITWSVDMKRVAIRILCSRKSWSKSTVLRDTVRSVPYPGNE